MIKKAILYDLDNTLYDYDIPNKRALKQVFKVLNKYVNITYDRFIKLFNLSRREIHRELAGTASSHNRTLYFQRLIEKTNKTVEPNLVLELESVYWGYMLKHMKLGKGVLSTLREIKKRGMQIAIVSDLTTNIQLRKLEALNISDYVDVLVTSEEAGSEKPHLIMFLLALNKLDLTPKDVLMVGDNIIADIEGANSAKIDTVLIKKGRLPKGVKEDYQKANYTIREMSDILRILDKIEHSHK